MMFCRELVSQLQFHFLPITGGSSLFLIAAGHTASCHHACNGKGC